MDELTKDKLADIKDMKKEIGFGIQRIETYLKHLQNDWERIQLMEKDL